MTIRFSRTLSFIAFRWLALAALPAQADALDEYWAKSENRIELGQCLRALKEAVDDDRAGMRSWFSIVQTW